MEIDSAILGVDGVAEAVCFGIDDDMYGEVVWAGVVLKQGQAKQGPSVDAEQRIRTALDGKIAKFKIPDRCVQPFHNPCTMGIDKMQDRRHGRDPQDRDRKNTA